MTENLRDHALVNDSLGSALRSGDHAFGNVPALLKRVLEEGTWRHFVTKRGEDVTHDRFESFVTAKPLRGLGASMELIARTVGTDDPELLRLLRDANKSGRGKKVDADSASTFRAGNGASDYLAQRLKQFAPEEYAAVVRGERTIHAAAVRAGFRPRRVPIRLDSAESVAETLRKHMAPDQIKALLKLLAGE